MTGSGPKLIYILAGAVGLLAVLSSSGIRTILLLNEEIEKLESRIEEVREENNQLSNELKWIENEEEYLEFLARKKLGLIKPGEKKYYIMISDPD